MDHLIKTFKNFIDLVDKTYNNYPFGLRYGQTIMNVLYNIWPNKYKEFIGTKFNCFYDDGLVQFTLDELEKTWVDFESTTK